MCIERLKIDLDIHFQVLYIINKTADHPNTGSEKMKLSTIRKLGTRVKIKRSGTTHRCTLLEVDELGNYIIQLHNGLQTVLQLYPHECTITHTFRTKVEYINDNGDLSLTRTTRTATLKQTEQRQPFYQWQENYMTRTLHPDAQGAFFFHENLFMIGQ